MKSEQLILMDSELEKFTEFLELHKKCDERDFRTLVGIYNVKLIFNISGSSVIPTCLCSSCGNEELLADQERYKETYEMDKPIILST